jgi:prophage regulatory protein
MGRSRKPAESVAGMGIARRWGVREWDAWRRGVESGKVLGREDGLEMAEDLPRRAGRLLRLPEVMKLTGLSRATIYRLERAGRFPRRARISDNSVGWYEREVLAWQQGRPRPRSAAR